LFSLSVSFLLYASLTPQSLLLRADQVIQ